MQKIYDTIEMFLEQETKIFSVFMGNNYGLAMSSLCKTSSSISFQDF
jgi:hypothetical protein